MRTIMYFTIVSLVCHCAYALWHRIFSKRRYNNIVIMLLINNIVINRIFF